MNPVLSQIETYSGKDVDSDDDAVVLGIRLEINFLQVMVLTI
ncbi:hypothetical protein [Desulfobacula sp.]|nr:hypothetical protein [Desulfobacula sp.]